MRLRLRLRSDTRLVIGHKAGGVARPPGFGVRVLRHGADAGFGWCSGCSECNGVCGFSGSGGLRSVITRSALTTIAAFTPVAAIAVA